MIEKSKSKSKDAYSVRNLTYIPAQSWVGFA